SLGREVMALGLGPWESFWVLFYGFATYGNAGYMREQVCKYMCPYARFQSAMFDRDTLIVSYDPGRGEPRGNNAKRGRKGEAS
ncbi:4Fe-4S dicluster domain-containing protein, partial [Acinetobacter baumannii]